MRRFPLQIGGVGGGPAARSAAGNLSNRLRYPFGRRIAWSIAYVLAPEAVSLGHAFAAAYSTDRRGIAGADHERRCVPRQTGEYMLSEPAEPARQKVLLAVKSCGWVYTRGLWGWLLFVPGRDLPFLSGRLRVKLDPARVTVEVHRVPTQRRADTTVERLFAAIELPLLREPHRKQPAGRGERRAISGLMIALVAASLFAAFTIGVPKKTVAVASAGGGTKKTRIEIDSLPGPALEQPSLYHAEIGLAIFLGGLLVLTPAFVGVAQGRLPIEVSPRGINVAREVATEAATNDRLDAIEDRLTGTEARGLELR